MENFLSFIRQAHLLVGFDFDGRFKKNRKICILLTFIRYFNLAVLIIGFIQMLIYLFLAGPTDRIFIDTVLLLILNIHAIMKTVMELRYLDEMKAFIFQIDDIYKTSLGGYSTADGCKMWRFMAKIGSRLYIGINLLPILQFLIGFLEFFNTPAENVRNSDVIQFGFYFPFDSYDYLPWTLFYISMIYSKILNTCMVPDQIAIFDALFLTNCFERLSENAKEMIDGAEFKNFSENKNLLENAVDTHARLIELCGELNEFYKYLLFQVGITDAFVVAIVGYKCVGQQLLYVLAVIPTLLKPFFFYYAGQKLAESSQKVAEKIAESNIQKMPKSLKKNLILMIQMSQKRQGLVAAGLIHFDLTTYMTLVNSAFTYITVLRSLYQ